MIDPSGSLQFPTSLGRVGPRKLEPWPASDERRPAVVEESELDALKVVALVELGVDVVMPLAKALCVGDPAVRRRSRQWTLIA